MSAYLQIRNYHRPAGLARAVEILASFGTKARVIAGGSTLWPGGPALQPWTTSIIWLTFPGWDWIISKRKRMPFVSVRPPISTPSVPGPFFRPPPIVLYPSRPEAIPPKPSGTEPPWEAICATHPSARTLPCRCWFWTPACWRPVPAGKEKSGSKTSLRAPTIAPWTRLK